MGERSASDFRSFFRIPGEDKVECRFTDAGSELGAGNAPAPHCKETGFSSPAFTPRPSFCSTPHCFVFPSCIGKKGCRSTMFKEAPNCSSSWLLESKVILILSLVRGANPNSRWRIGSEQFLWEGECVLLTEAFITLDAGASRAGKGSPWFRPYPDLA